MEFKVGTNFATNCDVRGHTLITGHRGFNQEGAEVKIWDLRKFGADECLLNTYAEHKFTPEAVRFLPKSTLIVTASKDQSMHLIDPKLEQAPARP